MTTTPTPSAHVADLIPITSPVIRHLPELLDVHRLAVGIHRSLSEPGAELSEVLSGWVLADARGYLEEAYRALAAVSRTVAKGREETARESTPPTAQTAPKSEAAPVLGRFITWKTLWGELDGLSDGLARAGALVELCRTVNTRKGRAAAEYAGLAETSVAEALWIAEESLRESSARITSLLRVVERERDQGGGQ